MRCLDGDHFDIAMVTIETASLRRPGKPVAGKQQAQVVAVGHARQAGEKVFKVRERVLAVALAGDDERVDDQPSADRRPNGR